MKNGDKHATKWTQAQRLGKIAFLRGARKTNNPYTDMVSHYEWKVIYERMQKLWNRKLIEGVL